jgi:hypothetical protein
MPAVSFIAVVFDAFAVDQLSAETHPDEESATAAASALARTAPKHAVVFVADAESGRTNVVRAGDHGVGGTS